MSAISDIASQKKDLQKQKRKIIRQRELEKKATVTMTSLMDIFTNVLIYLLMNYSTSPVDIQQTEERKLPTSNTELPLDPTVTLEVTTRAILVNRGKVCDVQDGRVDASLKKDKNASSYHIIPLFEALKKAATQQKKIAQYNKQVKFDGKITVVGDFRMPFRLLSEVMYTAGQAEFGKFKFAVIRK